VPDEPAAHYFASARPRVLAHRGFARDAPENTLPAFAAALELGVSHLETDVHASRDGIAVIAHDPDLSRVASRPGRVSDMSAGELARVELGGSHGFATLADALAAFPEARFNIDIKSADAVAPTVDAVRQCRAEHRVLLTSFSERRRAAALRLMPAVATSASGPRFAVALSAARVGAHLLVRRALSGIHAVQIPLRALGGPTTTPPLLAAFHAAEVEVHVWTINDEPTMRALLERGVDGIVTDRADIAMRLIHEQP
jgi:glycerophosphoryl diester phosphodiesterase